MQLFQRMKIWKELRRLEQRAREEPSPTTFVDLGQVHINLDMPVKAERVALDGLQLFPRSTELRQLLDCARRGLRKQRIAELRTRLVRTPTPELFRDLALLQLEHGDASGLQATCQQWSSRHPDDSGPWLMQAQARLTAFYRDLAARDGQEAMRLLERVVANGTEEPLARRLLGELLFRIGAVNLARQHLEVLRSIRETKAEATLMLEHIRELPDHGDDVDGLLAEVEEHGCLQHPSLAAAAPRGSGDEALVRIREGLAMVAEIPGVRKAACIKGSRALVKGAIRDGRDPFLRVVRVIAKAAHRFSRRLDLGSAKKSVVDVPDGHVCVCVYGELVAGVACDPGTDLDAVLADLQEIVAGTLYASGGPGS